MTLDWNKDNIDEVARNLLLGKITVLPTDTLYGLVSLARDEEAFRKVYEMKNRNPKKKCIILIGDIEDLKQFEVALTSQQKEFLSAVWPGPVSVELPCTSEKMSYLRQGTTSLSFRLPKDELLTRLLKITGPLTAPSANPEGLEPAKNIEEAAKYFGDEEIIYVDGGEKSSPPSTLVSLLGEEPEVIRGSLPTNFPKY